MNQHQELQQRLNASGLTGNVVGDIWKAMKQHGFDAAISMLEQAVENLKPKLDALQPAFTFSTWGAEHIEQGAIEQMVAATRLPVSVAAGLMPDAHVGYGLPIGGVLATDNAVLPYGVGVDIGCQVRLSYYAMETAYLETRHDGLKAALIDNTRFGVGCNWRDRPAEHPILDDPRWKETKLLRGLWNTAVDQLGTSGGGNHFVEWGYIKQGAFERLALLSHSGSRGVGARICDHYTKIAKDLHPSLEGTMKNLAWLDMSTEAGQEYWLSMQLAGAFADANHDIIHQRLSQAIGLEPVHTIGSKHNFAWMTMLEDHFVYVHRKGATPADEGLEGIIPGTMTAGSFIVKGKGNRDSLQSASHGAGRRMGRKEALRTLSAEGMAEAVAAAGITLIGSSLDESPEAYKDPTAVMDAQTDLVEYAGKFIPKIVIMAADGVAED